MLLVIAPLADWMEMLMIGQRAGTIVPIEKLAKLFYFMVMLYVLYIVVFGDITTVNYMICLLYKLFTSMWRSIPRSRSLRWILQMKQLTWKGERQAFGTDWLSVVAQTVRIHSRHCPTLLLMKLI
eukprot:s6546_g3.t1